MGGDKNLMEYTEICMLWSSPYIMCKQKQRKFDLATNCDFHSHFFLWMILPEQCNGPIINKLYCHFYAHYGKVGNKLGTLLPYFI